MEKYDVKFKKKFGQNFLKDDSVVKKIVEACRPSKKDLVIEVGPGGAILTKHLAEVSKEVLAYEIDTDLKDELDKKLTSYSNVLVLYKDFLETDIKKDIENKEYNNLYFISNVPYYITTPIIMKLMESQIKFKKICLMIQKEVADRLSAVEGTKDYGSITVLLKTFYNIKKEFFVSKEEFIPKPKVDSQVISLEEKEEKPYIKDYDFFVKFVRDCFQFKRKNIKNNLKKYDLEIISNILEKYGFDLSVRAEQLEVSIFIELANKLV